MHCDSLPLCCGAFTLPDSFLFLSCPTGPCYCDQWNNSYNEGCYVKAMMRAKSLQLCPTLVTPWTVACQALLSMVFSRQEYWSGLHAFLHGIFPTQGLNLHHLCPLHWQVGSLLLVPPGKLKATLGTLYHFRSPDHPVR